MKGLSLADKCIITWIFMIGLAETGHLLMVFGNRPFSDAVVFFAAGICIGGCACGIRWWKKRRGRETGKGARRRAKPAKGDSGITAVYAAVLLVFVLLFLFQIMTIWSQDHTDRGGDQTIETVESILETGSVYAVDPLTGSAYTEGLPLRIRILGLPTLYAILCRLLGISAWKLLTKAVPTAVLLLGYMAYWILAKQLFPNRQERERRLLFLAIVAALICCGSYAFGMDGYGILYCGYRGTTIRSAILLPYTLALCLQHRWKQTLLCLLAEACIVWTLYGLGACLPVVCGMGAIRLWQIRRNGSLHTVGEEG